MKSLFLKFFVMAIMLLGLPMLGVILAGYPPAKYLEFPPHTKYVSHAPFSWIAFTCYALIVLLATLPLIFRAIKTKVSVEPNNSPSYPFPWWGWFGLLSGICFWIMAWTRFPWFNRFQPHTFFPLWLSYILVINALNQRKKGACMMIRRPGFFLLLFPVSAMFWWFFEYLNRFVQNWYYVGANYDPLEYFLWASLSFSTVLPAVLGTRDLLCNIPLIKEGFTGFFQWKIVYPKLLASCTIIISGAGLAGIGVWPGFFSSLLWLSPLFIVVSLQTLIKERHVFSDITHGNWSVVVSYAIAALICGLFWEMWNFYSLAKWEYSVPFVHRFKIFEMPLIGYAGYIPFGVECALIGGIFEQLTRGRTGEPD
jgi:hypothetical protein